jgi:hypothetical protein
MIKNNVIEHIWCHSFVINSFNTVSCSSLWDFPPSSCYFLPLRSRHYPQNIHTWRELKNEGEDTTTQNLMSTGTPMKADIPACH